MLAKFGIAFIVIGLFGAIVDASATIPLLIGAALVVLSIVRSRSRSEYKPQPIKKKYDADDWFIK